MELQKEFFNSVGISFSILLHVSHPHEHHVRVFQLSRSLSSFTLAFLASTRPHFLFPSPFFNLSPSLLLPARTYFFLFLAHLSSSSRCQPLRFLLFPSVSVIFSFPSSDFSHLRFTFAALDFNYIFFSHIFRFSSFEIRDSLAISKTKNADVK